MNGTVSQDRARNARSLVLQRWLTPGRIGWLVSLAGLSYLGVRLLFEGPTVFNAWRAAYQAVVPLAMRRPLWNAREYLWGITTTAYLNPWNYALLIFVFVLERVMPARKEQRVFSAGLFQDFIWSNTDALFRMAWLPLFIGFLKSMYNAHLGFLTIHAIALWPAACRVAVAFLVYDFLHWFHHLVRHRVQVLWYFHMIHHSQRQMNFFTDARVHIVEYLASKTLIFIPLFMFQLDANRVFWLAIATHWYTRIYHANLRTNYGIFKHVLVSPQSHRIHHSIEPRHWEKNFGVFFTVWDRMFGTLYPHYDEYPETGVEDDRLPLEQTVAGLSRLGTYLAQLLYPFRLIVSRKPQSAS